MSQRRYSKRLEERYNNPVKKSNNAFNTRSATLSQVTQNTSGISPLAAANIFMQKELGTFPPVRLSDSDAKPFLELFEESDRVRKRGKSFVKKLAMDKNQRPLEVFGVQDDVFKHPRSATPQSNKRSSNEDDSHAFPQSGVNDSSVTDKADLMVAENWVGNQGTTRFMERMMERADPQEKRDGHIAKYRKTEFNPASKDTSPSMVQDTVLKRTNSSNHIDVLFSFQHDNDDIPRGSSGKGS